MFCQHNVIINHTTRGTNASSKIYRKNYRCELESVLFQKEEFQQLLWWIKLFCDKNRLRIEEYEEIDVSCMISYFIIYKEEHKKVVKLTWHTLSATKKNLMAICLVLSLFDLPFFTKAIVDMLSWLLQPTLYNVQTYTRTHMYTRFGSLYFPFLQVRQCFHSSTIPTSCKLLPHTFLN